MAKRYFDDYLHFTKKERRGIVAILVLLVSFLLLPFFFHYFKKTPQNDNSQFEKEIAALQFKQQDSSDNYANRSFDEASYQHYYPDKNDNSKPSRGELFYFDPNTLSVAGWIKLGIREKTANTIKNYTSKGGRFYKPDDIGKIWGLQDHEINRLLPYIRIEARPTNNFTENKYAEPVKIHEKQKYSMATVDINEADTSAFIALPGIGSKLANRIISFRDKLGGFHKVEQVAETFALPDSTFQKIKDKLVIANPEVKKININKATLDELKTHPYIRYNIGNAIVQYRTTHGAFADVSDLKKIMIISENIYSKAAPYLTTK